MQFVAAGSRTLACSSHRHSRVAGSDALDIAWTTGIVHDAIEMQHEVGLAPSYRRVYSGRPRASNGWPGARHDGAIRQHSRDGQVVRWAVEMQSGPNIVPQGFTKQTFKVGDEVTVTLEPVKNGRPLGRLLRVVLADGSTLPLGASNPQN